jgi:hypothetical protein
LLKLSRAGDGSILLTLGSDPAPISPRQPDNSPDVALAAAWMRQAANPLFTPAPVEPTPPEPLTIRWVVWTICAGPGIRVHPREIALPQDTKEHSQQVESAEPAVDVSTQAPRPAATVQSLRDENEWLPVIDSPSPVGVVTPRRPHE